MARPQSLNSGPNRRAFELVGEVNRLANAFDAHTDDEFAAWTSRLKKRLKTGDDFPGGPSADCGHSGSSLPGTLPFDVLSEGLAAAREAIRRETGLWCYDVQLLGAAVLCDGCIAEMQTGEGKTLVAILAAYLQALNGKPVHVVTANEYLAERDCDLAGRVLRRLNMTAGLTRNGATIEEKHRAYSADVTYGTPTEFGFDYLRDNLAYRLEDTVQLGHGFAIIDEADSVLLDEARTPLVISTSTAPREGEYVRFARAASVLNDDDVEIDEAEGTVAATDAGLRKIEHLLGIEDVYADASGRTANHLYQALRAQFLFHRDKDYVVVDGAVGIVDEFTGRVLQGRRYSEGLHQALEAKEGLPLSRELRTQATISVQGYFHLYDHLSGMTGTALTDAAEFASTYELPVVAIPANRPSQRTDRADRLFPTLEAKQRAIAEAVRERHAKGQPCLIGTGSVEASEALSAVLDATGIPHETLNARNPAREAAIVARAGALGAVTIATNMAGRGTDIVLGAGSADDAEAAASLGGLAVIGTEHFASRRIDDQLRGRSGRQGDPGETIFYVSLEDDLMRLYGGERTLERLKSLVPDEGIVVASRTLKRALDEVQQTIEGQHRQVREEAQHYDELIDRQRRALYEFRRAILEGRLPKGETGRLLEEAEAVTGAPLDRAILLAAIDLTWTQYLQEMELLKRGISLRSIGQRDPLTEYQEEGHRAFEQLRETIFEQYRHAQKAQPHNH